MELNSRSSVKRSTYILVVLDVKQPNRWMDQSKSWWWTNPVSVQQREKRNTKMCLLGRVLYKVKEVPVCNYIFFSSSNFLLRILNKCEKRGKSRQKNLKSNQNSCRSNRQDRWGWARPSIRHILFLVWRGIVLPIKSGKREKKNRVFIIIIFLWIFEFFSFQMSSTGTTARKSIKDTQYWRFFIRFAVSPWQTGW